MRTEGIGGGWLIGLKAAEVRQWCRVCLVVCCSDHTLHAGLDDLLQVAQPFVVDDPDKLVRAAAQGHLDVVRDTVRKHPCKVRAVVAW